MAHGGFMRRLLLLAALCLCAATPALAQVDRATLSGLVKDASGAALPGATVTVTNLATNTASRQSTTETGAYLIVNLIPGRYQIDVELPAFKKSSQTVTLEVAQRARLDIALAVGRVSETVTRHGRHAGSCARATRRSAPSIAQTQVAQPAARDPQLGRPARARAWRAGGSLHRAGRRHVVRPDRRHQRPRRARAAEQLPARRRGQQQHLRERPGADDAGVAAVGGRDSGVQGRHEPVLGGVRPVAGRRRQRLDQVGHQRASTARPTSTSATERWTPTTSSRSAPAPPSPPTNRTSSAATSADRSCKDRAFFFADYEGTRITRGVTRLTRVPTADERAGIFTGRQGSDDRAAVPGNRDPADRIDPVRRGDHRAGAAAESARREQLLPHRRSDRQLRPAPGARRLAARTRVDSVFVRYIYSNRDR